MMTRFADIDSLSSQPPIYDYVFVELVPLEKAILPLINIVGKIKINARKAKLAMEKTNLEYGLTLDEAATLCLYSIQTGANGLYRLMNAALRANVEEKLRPWFRYLKLLHTALNKLPSVQARVWRGVGKSIGTSYRQGMSVVWFSVSSCSKDLGVVKNFLSQEAHSTLFSVTCQNGKSIARYSLFPEECEIILMPGTQLRVSGSPLEHNMLQIVDLEELQNENIWKKYAMLPAIGERNSSSLLDERQKSSKSSYVSSINGKKSPSKIFRLFS